MMTNIGNLRYDPKKVIGRGNFGVVFRGNYHRVDNISGSGKLEVAVKRILSSNVDDEESFLREVDLMKAAKDHPNILRYICTESNDDFM